MTTIAKNTLIKISPPELEKPLSKGAYSVKVFRDRLFLAEVYVDSTQPKDFARVVRYIPQHSSWEEVYSAFIPRQEQNTPSVQQHWENEPQFDQGKIQGIPLNSPNSQIAILPGNSELAECLYIRLVASATEKLLRSEDGDNFQLVETALAKIPQLFSSRQFLSFQGSFYALPSDSPNNQAFKGQTRTTIQVCAPGEFSQWQAANSSGFGDSSNREISELVAFNNSLYGTTVNLERGYQIWQMRVNDSERLSWEPILVNGAYRYSLNQRVFSMVPFKGDLYLASGLDLESGKEQQNKSYPAGFEIIRIYPDGNWDLIAGTPKFTKDGLKVPLSAMGPGFDDPYSCAIACLNVHQGYLYLGTQNLEIFQLWRSEDGEIWESLTLNDELSRYHQVELEVRDAFSTPWGLVLAVDYLKPDGSKNLQIWLAENFDY